VLADVILEVGIHILWRTEGMRDMDGFDGYHPPGRLR